MKNFEKISGMMEKFKKSGAIKENFKKFVMYNSVSQI